jgi:hypothetical protein
LISSDDRWIGVNDAGSFYAYAATAALLRVGLAIAAFPTVNAYNDV